MLMNLLIGLVGVMLGFLLCVSGYRIARILIPLWGFVAGFIMGAAGVSDAMNSTFIGTSLGIVVGLFVGILFAVLAYFFFSIAIILLGASIGYWIGSGFIELIGFDNGFLTALVGISLGVVFAIIAILTNFPKYYLILLSSVSGALAIVTGVAIIFDQTSIHTLNYSSQIEYIKDLSIIPAIAFVVIAIMAIITQIKLNADYTIDSWGKKPQN
mgnify:FL=1